MEIKPDLVVEAFGFILVFFGGVFLYAVVREIVRLVRGKHE